MKTPILSTLAVLATNVAAQNSNAVVITQTISPDCFDLASTASGNCSLPIIDHLTQVCLPQQAGSTPDNPQFDAQAPCVAVPAIEFQCLYGPEAGRRLFPGIIGGGSGVSAGIPEGVTPPDNATQRNCVCQSAFFDAIRGCNSCFDKHGGTEFLKQLAGTLQSSRFSISDFSLPNLDGFSSSYCAASATPSVNFGEALLSAAATSLASVSGTIAQSIPTSSTLTLSDPLGNKTDISLYYSTPGPSYWAVSLPTGSPSVNNGQIAATVATGGTPANTNPGSSSTSSGSAAPSSTGGSGAGSLTALSGGAVIAVAGFFAML